MSSPAPTGEKLFLLLLCSRHRGREPRQIHPPGNVTRLQEPAHWVIHMAFCLAIWREATSVSQGFVPALLGQLVPNTPYPQHCLPAAPHTQDRAPVCDQQDRARRRHDLSAGKLPLSPSCYRMMLMPMQAVCFQKPVPFYLSSIPFSCWFSLTHTGMPEHRSHACIQPDF